MTDTDANDRGTTLVAVVGAIGRGALLWFGYLLIYFLVSSWNHDLADLIGGWLLFLPYFFIFYAATSAIGWLLLGVPVIVLTRRYQRHNWSTLMPIAVVVAIIMLFIDNEFFGRAFAVTVIGQVALYLYSWQRQQSSTRVASD